MNCCGKPLSPAKLWLTLLLLCAGLAAGIAYFYRFDTYHFAEVQRGVLYRDGNRGMREFATACRKAQVRTVIMLVSQEEAARPQFQLENDFCNEKGIGLVHIPVRLGGRPSTQDVRRFLDIATDPKNQPLLVHCAQGVRRTAMMVAAYQETVLGYENDKAKAAILPWGRKAERLNDIRGFIDDYDPATRTVGNANVVEVPIDPD
jgi:tyrosine-protein phosphatase SIW14